jgi:hypothetical protein
MTEQEKEEIIALMARGQTALRSALRGVSHEGSLRSPGAGRWSILQCVEHVAVTEGYLLAQVESAKIAETALPNPEREARIKAHGADRLRRVESPDVCWPKGEFASLAEAFGQFQSNRERTVEFLERNQEDLRVRIAQHPILGKVNCHEMLLLMAVHPHRHAEQVAEIAATLMNS